MKSNENHRLLKYILKYEPKTTKQHQAFQNFTNYINKRKKKIEQLQSYSVPNQIYIFPRGKAESSSSSSISQSMENRNDESLSYNLVLQNKRNKSYQYSSQLHFKNTSLQKETERLLSKIKTKSELNQSLDRNELVRSIKKAKMAKQQSPFKNNSRKKKKQQQKTLLNSSKRLIVAEQYSLGTHPNQANTKKGSENATVNCRSKPVKIKVKTEA